MIYEHARITIHDGKGRDFEDAFNQTGRSALLRADGVRTVTLHRSAETPDVYLLRVQWQSLDHHLKQFPGTPEAQQLERAIAQYFAEVPAVEHFEAADAGVQ